MGEHNLTFNGRNISENGSHVALSQHLPHELLVLVSLGAADRVDACQLFPAVTKFSVCVCVSLSCNIQGRRL